MKLKFKNQDFQNDAVNVVADLFAGQEKIQSTFEISQGAQMSLMQNELGIGNSLLIPDEQLNINMHEVQKQHNLPLSDVREDMRSFCVEMETGTGKTYGVS